MANDGTDGAPTRHGPTGLEGWLPGVSTGVGGIEGARRPTGIGLALSGDVFRVVILDASGSALIELGPYAEDEIVAIWRSLSASSGLPLVIEGADGAWDQAYGQIGRLVVGPRIERRRLAVLSGRRPRFLVRRKPARLPRRPVIYREKEIATGRGR